MHQMMYFTACKKQNYVPKFFEDEDVNNYWDCSYDVWSVFKSL